MPQFVVALLDAELEEVRVEALKEDTFYAVAKLRLGDKISEIDCRPSDAFVLAVLTDGPIYVADEGMEKTAIAIPESVTDLHPKAKGLGEMMAKWEQRRSKGHKVKVPGGEPGEEKLAALQKSREELLAYVFGGEEDEPASM